MARYDPNNTRVTASRKLNNVLINSQTVVSGKQADRVTVVDFSSEGDVRVLAPLEDPMLANATFSQVNVRNGTFIGGGIMQAMQEIVQGSGETRDKSALVVLTDGVDNTISEVDRTIEAITAAGDAGIRVHFGFLNLAAALQDPFLIRAILDTGGVFAEISSTDDIDKFVASVLSTGLTGAEDTGYTLLLSNLSLTGHIVNASSQAFQYAMMSGETINITVTAMTAGLVLNETTYNGFGSVISSDLTNSSGLIANGYVSSITQYLTFNVTSSTNITDGLFSIIVHSDNACGGLMGILNATSGGMNEANSTGSSTPSSSTPVVPVASNTPVVVEPIASSTPGVVEPVASSTPGVVEPVASSTPTTGYSNWNVTSGSSINATNGNEIYSNGTYDNGTYGNGTYYIPFTGAAGCVRMDCRATVMLLTIFGGFLVAAGTTLLWP